MCMNFFCSKQEQLSSMVLLRTRLPPFVHSHFNSKEKIPLFISLPAHPWKLSGSWRMSCYPLLLVLLPRLSLTSPQVRFPTPTMHKPLSCILISFQQNPSRQTPTCIPSLVFFPLIFFSFPERREQQRRWRGRGETKREHKRTKHNCGTMKYKQWA